MRPLLTPTRRPRAEPVDDGQLAQWYAYPDVPWLRANFVSTLDGAAQGPDRRSASISSDVDRDVFAVQRALADVIVVGAGTARVEGYRPADIRPGHEQLRRALGLAPRPAIAVVSASLAIAAPLLAAPDTLVFTCAAAPADRLAAVAALGDRIEVAGDDRVDLARLRAALERRGYSRMLCEGGPRTLTAALADDAVDELCLTLSPLLTAGAATRIVNGPLLPTPLPLTLGHLLETDGTLFSRWLTPRGRGAVRA